MRVATPVLAVHREPGFGVAVRTRSETWQPPGPYDSPSGYSSPGKQFGEPMSEEDVADAMRRAAIAAGLACLKPGAQPSIPTAAEVDARVG